MAVPAFVADPPAPRLVPGRPLPAYAHRPGRTPHPVRDPAGHAHGTPAPVIRPIDERTLLTEWCDDTDWLFGCDLHDHGCWWEAHEAWEVPWRGLPRESGLRHALQAFIQDAATRLLAEVGRGVGARRMRRRAEGHRGIAIARLPDPHDCLGVDLLEWRDACAAHDAVVLRHPAAPACAGARVPSLAARVRERRF